MAFGDEALFFLEAEEAERANNKLIHQLGRIATALERDVDRQADAALTAALLAYKKEERKIRLLISQSGYTHLDWYTGYVEVVEMGTVTIKTEYDTLTVFRISTIRGVSEAEPPSNTGWI